MGTKFYAVRKGRTPGIYFSWEDCERQIRGFPNAQYKKFSSLAEAQSFIFEDSVTKSVSSKNERRPISSEDMIAYVDGSFLLAEMAFSYGAVILTDKGTREFSKRFEHNEDAGLRNVAGELFGAMFAMKLALSENKKNLHLYYDYKGIEEWAKGRWKTNRELTKSYRDYVKQCEEHLQIHFHKVMAHTGDPLNERADILAKAELNIK